MSVLSRLAPRRTPYVLLALLVACAQRPPSADPAALAHMREGAQDLILIAIDNPPEPAMARAGSTPRAYDFTRDYTVGADARAALAEVRERYGLRPVADWPIAPLRLYCAVLGVPDGRARASVLAALAHEGRVRLAQPLNVFRTLSSTYNDPYFGLQHAFLRIKAADAQQWSQGEGVRVAVIDTGLDRAHPDLRGRVVLQRSFADTAAQEFDRDRHGTEVAGVIAADANNHEGIVGVAPEVELLALKACWALQPGGEAAECNSFTLAQALTVAIESGARVINLSLGGPADPLLEQLTEYALAHGIVVVGAVPPDGRLDGFPVGVPGVIAVDVEGRGDGDARVLYAPGREILTLTPGGHYDFVSGSSLAAAHVSGVTALLLARNPRLAPAAVYAALQSGLSNRSIDAYAALACVLDGSACRVLATAVAPTH